MLDHAGMVPNLALYIMNNIIKCELRMIKQIERKIRKQSNIAISLWWNHRKSRNYR